MRLRGPLSLRVVPEIKECYITAIEPPRPTYFLFPKAIRLVIVSNLLCRVFG